MVNRAMVRIAREIILVSDASKFSKRGMVRIAPFSEIDTVIATQVCAKRSKRRCAGWVAI